MLLPLVVLMFVIGILPGLIIKPTETSVNNLLTLSEERSVVQVESFATHAWFDIAQDGQLNRSK